LPNKQKQLHKQFAKKSSTLWADFLQHGEYPPSTIQLNDSASVLGPRDGQDAEQAAALVVQELLQLHKKLGTGKVNSF